jgi:argininosuccinate lyase
MAHKALWGGRFKGSLSELALEFSSSIDLDSALYKEDIAGSIAHVEMLAACNIITKTEMVKISRGLIVILNEIESGKFKLSSDYEDVHMAIEQRLIQKIGRVGGKLHTGRSRNDQIALDERLYLRGAVTTIMSLIRELQRALVSKAGPLTAVLMPGYTHMQRAQPVPVAHHLLAYVGMMDRDRQRFAECRARINKSPLGAGALAGTAFPINRHLTAKKLSFDGIIENSIDAVSDRDFIIEFISACSITMMHLSRFAEELVIWMTKEFHFVTMSDSITTGSSMLPHKKNPDIAELVRGKTGHVYGALVALLTTMKGLPLAYNRDMQEDKTPMLSAHRITASCLSAITHVLHNTQFNTKHLEEELRTDFMTALDISDYLVGKGIPFREAHAITGKIVAYCIEHKMYFGNLDLDTIRLFSPVFKEDVFEYILPHISSQRKKSAGAASPAEVKKQLAAWKKTFAKRDN